MRILVLTNLYPNPYQPHLAAFNRLQFRALAAQHQVQVIAPIAWTGEWSARRGGAPLALSPDRTRISDGMVIHHPRYAFTPKVLRGLYGQFFVESVRECFQDAVRTSRPEAVLGCWAFPDGWAAVQLAREAGLPVAIKVHGSDVLGLADQPTRRRQTAQALKEADAVIAVSLDLGENVVALGADPSRVHTVYNGIDASVFSPGPGDAARRELGIEASDPLILFVGNLVAVKGLDVLVSALETLLREGVTFQAALVGDGPLKGELQERIDGLGLGSRVRLIGPRPQSQLPAWYRSASLLVLPSRSEGIPNVMLEAAACGTPCVASRVGGIPEIAIPDLLVAPGDPSELARKIRKVLGAPGTFRGTVARQPSSWSESARALSEVLQGISAAAPRALAG